MVRRISHLDESFLCTHIRSDHETLDMMLGSTKVADILGENLRRFQAGEELYNIVVKERGY